MEVAHRCRCPHVGSALSCVDILSVLYFDVLNLEPWDQRDIFILSKGHASLALCCTLSQRGIIEEDLLEGYFTNDGSLPAHLDRFTARGIEASTGALGHGFNIGLGIAFGFKKKVNSVHDAVVLMGLKRVIEIVLLNDLIDELAATNITRGSATARPR